MCTTTKLQTTVHVQSVSFLNRSHIIALTPSALIFHAGGFVLGSTAMIPKSQINSLVNKGFVVVTPEYRLCPQVSLYEGPIQDAKESLKWCQEELPKLMREKGVEVDGKRVVGMGHSAGGQLALTTVRLCSSYTLISQH